MARSPSRGLLYTAPPETQPNRGDESKANEGNPATLETDHSTPTPADD